MFRRRPVVVRRAGSPLLRTALVGGAGYLAGKSMTQNAGREAAQEQQQAVPPPTYAAPPPSQPPASGAEPDTLTQLKQLGDLRSSGVINDQEFEQEKQKILRKSSTT